MTYDIGTRPARCRLINLVSGETVECLLNPPQLTEKLGVQWNRLAVPGLAYSPMQYQSTANRQVVGLEFAFDASLHARTDILAFRSFLRALTIPPPRATGVINVAPPRVLLLWPGVLTMECVVSSVELQYKHFGADGSVLVYTATVTFEEVLDLQSSAAGALEELA